MDASTGEQKKGKPRGTNHSGLNRKGRPRGAKNKLTTDIMQAMIAAAYSQKKESFRAVCRDILGLHSPDALMVEGKPIRINGKAIKVRDKFKQIMAEIGLPAEQRTMKVTDQDLRFVGMMLAHAEGTPGKAAPESDGKPRMPFVGKHGLPWQYDVMEQQERQALEAQRDQEKIDQKARQQLLGAAETPKADEDEDYGDAPEIVRG